MGKYRVISADCPWRYGSPRFAELKLGQNGGARNHYETLHVDDLGAMPIRSLAHPEGCVLIFWTTWPRSRDAHKVLDAWGAEYITGFPWLKIQGQPERWPNPLPNDQILVPVYGTGYWARGMSEMVLIARFGQPKVPNSAYVGLISERFQHSRKPLDIYDYAHQFSGPYAELFSRGEAPPHWDQWGDEIESTPSLTAALGERVIERVGRR